MTPYAAEVATSIARRAGEVRRIGAWAALHEWVRRGEQGPAVLAVLGEEPESWRRLHAAPGGAA